MFECVQNCMAPARMDRCRLNATQPRSQWDFHFNLDRGYSGTGSLRYLSAATSVDRFGVGYAFAFETFDSFAFPLTHRRPHPTQPLYAHFHITTNNARS